MDMHIGRRIRAGRVAKNISRRRLAELLGRPLIEVRRFENGATRVGVAQLYAVSLALEVTTGWFFEGLTNALPPAIGHLVPGPDGFPDSSLDELVAAQTLAHRDDMVFLLTAYNKIDSIEGRRQLLEIALVMAARDIESADLASETTVTPLGRARSPRTS